MKTLFSLLILVLIAFAAQAQPVVKVISADSYRTHLQTNCIIIQTNQAMVGFSIGVINLTGGTIYVQMFDTNGIPGTGAKPNVWHPVLLPTDSQASIDFGHGLPLSLGLVVCSSTSPYQLQLSSTNVAFGVVFLKTPR